MAIQYVTDLSADVTFNLTEPYVIPTTNNVLTIAVDGGAPQTITLTTGTRTAAQIASDLSSLTGVTISTVTIGLAPTVRIRTNSANGNSSSIVVSNNSTPANNYVGLPIHTQTGGVPISQFFNGETKALLINNLETQLNNAGWATVGGHQNGSLILMQSQMSPSPQNLKMRIAIKDNGGASVQISFGNMSLSRVSSNSTSVVSLTPKAGRGWQIIANKYQAMVLVNGSWEGGTFAFWGVPWLPSNLCGYLYECMQLQGNCNGDNDSAVRGSFRTSIFGAANGQPVNNNAYRGALTNGNIWETNANPAAGDIVLFGPIPINGGSSRWMNSYKPMCDAVIAWGPTNQGEEAKAMGLLWEAFVTREAYVGDHIVTLDGHTWQAITFNDTENQAPTLFLKVA